MFPSFQSLINFVSTNFLLFSVSLIDTYFTQQNNIIPLYLITYAKNQTFLCLIDYFTKHHPLIHHENRKHPIQNYPFEFLINVLFNSLIEVTYSYLLYSSFYPSNFTIQNISINIIYFIPISFLFEIIFDFFHYWTHRKIHEIPILYQHIHRKHHQHSHPNVYTTFYQDPIDLLITNMIPTFLSIFILQQFFVIDYTLWRMLNTYKVYIEICGHSGKNIPKTCSFVQCIWIPKILNIDLYTIDHDRHHSNIKCNYAKRFMLWDKIFGTYDRGIENESKETDTKET